MSGGVVPQVRVALAAALVAGAASIALFAPARGSNDPAATPTILDGYVFPGNDPSRVVIAFDVSPRLGRGAASTATFDPNVLYAIEIDNVGDGREHLTLQFQAQGTGALQRIAAYGPGVPDGTNANADVVRYEPLGATTFDRASTIDKGISLFAGVRRDPAFFDEAQFARIEAGRATCFREPGKAENGYRYDDVLAIVVEIPKTLLAPRKLGRIGVWWTASVPVAGADRFARVSRTGRAGIPKLSSIPSANSRSTELAAAIARFFAPDTLQADVEAPGPANYLGIETATPTPAPAVTGKKVPPAYRPFGGRDLSGPAIARTLGALYGDTVPRALAGPEDGRETPCLTSDNVTPPPNPAASTFPYLDDPI